MDGPPQSSGSESKDLPVKVPIRHHILFWLIALGGAGFDLETKARVFERVGPPGSPPLPILPPVLEFRTSHNTGALWGFGGSLDHSSLIFAMLSIMAGIFIYYWLFILGHARERKQTVALGLIMAGAIGNCYDRIRFGHVRDFVYFHVDSIGFDFPIFNFADNMLVAGALILIWLALRPDVVEDPADRKTQPVSQESRELV